MVLYNFPGTKGSKSLRQFGLATKYTEREKKQHVMSTHMRSNYSVFAGDDLNLFTFIYFSLVMFLQIDKVVQLDTSTPMQHMLTQQLL